MDIYLNNHKIEQLCYEIGQESLPTLLDIFLRELKDYQQELGGVSQQLDSTSFTDLDQSISNISHSLKSSAASFGADNLCVVATDIDAKAKSGETVNTLMNRHALLTSIQATIDAYEKLL